MDALELIEVCRLCPSSDNLLYVFDNVPSAMYNLPQIISIATGIEIMESDIVSKKICNKCRTLTMKIFEFRQDAIKHDRALKEKCSKLLVRGIKLPNTSVTLKKELTVQPSSDLQKPGRPLTERDLLHPSIADIYKTYPNVKLPKKCFSEDFAPVVSLTMGEAEKYFFRRKLDMRKFIYRPRSKTVEGQEEKSVARKRTAMPADKRTVSPLKISLGRIWETSQQSSVDEEQANPNIRKSTETSTCGAQLNEQSPRRSSNAQTPVDSPKLSNGALEIAGTPTTGANRPLPQSSTPEVEPNVTATDQVNEPSQKKELIDKSGFIESLGLTPTVTATKSQTMHVCSLCGSVHSSTHDLKRHSHKHMVCQFCKIRFKSLTAKQEHIDNDCHIKQVMNCKPTVELEKIEFNPYVRSKHKEVFKDFRPLPRNVANVPTLPVTSDSPRGKGKDEGEIVVTCTSEVAPKTSFVHSETMTEDVIVLSDDEQPVVQNSAIPSVAAPVIVPNLDSIAALHNSSIVKPDIHIKNNLLLTMLSNPVTDKDVVNDLLQLTGHQYSNKVGMLVQTEFPTNNDIKVCHADHTGVFKNLKEHMKSYKIPIELENGNFSIEYVNNSKAELVQHRDYWSNLPVITSDTYRSVKAPPLYQNNITELFKKFADKRKQSSLPKSSSSAVSIIQNIAFPSSKPANFQPPAVLNTTQVTRTHSNPIISGIPNKIARTNGGTKISSDRHSLGNNSVSDIQNKITRPNGGSKTPSTRNSLPPELSKFRVKDVWELQ